MRKLTCHCGKIEAEVNVPENYNSLLFGPITITDSLIITGSVKIKDLEDL